MRRNLPASCPAIAVRRTASLPLAYVPGIHVFTSLEQGKDVDGRDKPGHDEKEIRAVRGRLKISAVFQSGSLDERNDKLAYPCLHASPQPWRISTNLPSITILIA